MRSVDVLMQNPFTRPAGPLHFGNMRLPTTLWADLLEGVRGIFLRHAT